MIDAIAARLPRGAHLDLGPGDDAAVVRAPDRRVVATTDQFIEGRHFRRDWSGPADIGRKAAARNFADVAAMGARPTALLVAFAAPADLETAWVLQLADGIARECEAAGAGVAGGDTSSADSIVLSITALGDLAGGAPVTRAGARPGDVVAIAGMLGSAEAGLALLASGRAWPDELAVLVGAHRRPDPPYQAGPQAARLGATSMIDVSDGLLADLGHVARASEVTIALRSGALGTEPVANAAVLASAAGLLGLTTPTAWLEWVLTGGDDHALAATFPAQTVLPPGWTIVGEVCEGREVLVDGRKWHAAGGWEHFRRK